jgi:elongation factor P hydroxylase
MDWLFSIVRIAGASFPVASSLVQLQSEIDSKTLSKRVEKLDDSVSHLHKDIPELSKLIYQELKSMVKGDTLRKSLS